MKESLKYKGLPRNSQTEEVNQVLNKIEDDTFYKEKEAERRQMSVEEYENKNGRREPLAPEVLKETKYSEMNSFIKKWEIENKDENQAKYEKRYFNQVSIDVKIENNTSIYMPPSFLSHILRLAREAISDSYDFKKYGDVLDNLNNVSSIIIDEKSTDNFQFKVYINKKYASANNETEHFTFEVNSKGRVTLS